MGLVGFCLLFNVLFLLVIFLNQTQITIFRCCLFREKKKEQERDELWKKLDELKISNTTLVQNNSHGLSSVQNNNNNNNSNYNNNDNQEKSVDAAAAVITTTGNKDPDVGVASESTTCAK